MYKKIKYNSGEIIFKIKIIDENSSIIENWTVMGSDLSKWVNQMYKKYGLKRNKDRDLDWLK